MALTSALLALGNLHAGCSATTASRRSTGAATDVNPWGHPIAPDGARRVFSYTGTAPATPDRIYPLLCPVLEYDWIDDWSCTMEYSVSGVAEPGCAFRTSIQVGEQWLLTRHEPPTAIQYVVWLKQGWMVLDVTLRDLGDGTTELRWQRTFTAVRPLGRHLIGKMTEQQIGAEMAGLHGKLVAYLAVTAVDG
jgi:hypothetical protein